MKKYFNPEIEINAFNMENIITTSSIDGVALTRKALNDTGITSTETKALSSFDIINAG